MSTKTFSCEFCKKDFKTKGNLKSHQSIAKYCLEIRGKQATTFDCSFCKKSLTTDKILQEHLIICKEKMRIDKESEREKLKKSIERLERVNERQRREYEEKMERKLKEQKCEYEEKIDKIRLEYEKMRIEYENRIESRMDKHEATMSNIAMKSKQANIVNNTTTNNNTQQNFLNFDDKDRLNNIIENHVNQDIINKGQVGFAGVVYQKYLKGEKGDLLYKIVDTSRQNFEYMDEKGEVKVDLGAKKLTDAVSKSNLTRVVLGIAKDINDIFENKEKFEKVSQLTEFDKDNSKFRKEIVRLTKINDK